MLLGPRPLSTGRLGSALRTRRRPPPSPVLASVSPELGAFVRDALLARHSILEFVATCARDLEPGTRVLDAGAGDAPYRELFQHCEYRTADWGQSLHLGARRADVIASLDDLPLPDESFDAVLCTQVLEHVADPGAVLAELNRVLRAGGSLWLTVPLTWPLHEEPFDFFRYTPYGMTTLLGRAGFVDVDIAPLSSYFATIAQMLRIANIAAGWPNDRHEPLRARLYEDLERLADQLERFDYLDDRKIFPLGYQGIARRPS